MRGEDLIINFIWVEARISRLGGSEVRFLQRVVLHCEKARGYPSWTHGERDLGSEE